jgi:hypothetical protein
MRYQSLVSPLDDVFFHTLGLSSTTPPETPPRVLARERSNDSVVSRFQDSVAAAGQPHNLGSFPVITSQESRKEGRHMPALQLQLGTATRNGVDFSESFDDQ